MLRTDRHIGAVKHGCLLSPSAGGEGSMLPLEAMAVQTNSLVESNCSLKEPNPKWRKQKLGLHPCKPSSTLKMICKKLSPQKKGLRQCKGNRASKTAALASSQEAESWQTLRAPSLLIQSAFCETFLFTLFTLFGFTLPAKTCGHNTMA